MDDPGQTEEERAGEDDGGAGGDVAVILVPAYGVLAKFLASTAITGRAAVITDMPGRGVERHEV